MHIDFSRRNTLIPPPPLQEIERDVEYANEGTSPTIGFAEWVITLTNSVISIVMRLSMQNTLSNCQTNEDYFVS